MYDIAIIGGGPGGYAAALYAHNFDLSVALVERDKVGGTCLHRGCIPAKSWLQTASVFSEVSGASEFGITVPKPQLDWGKALERKNGIVHKHHTGLAGLLKRRGVDIIEGAGRLAEPGVVAVTGADGNSQQVEARSVILATGSSPRTIPGYDIDGDRIVTSDHALDWPARPERVAVIGAGAIGAEFASLLSDLGSTVHLIEALPQILPGVDAAAADVLDRALSKKGVSITTGVEVGPAEKSESGVAVPFGQDRIDVDVVLVAVGRAPVTDGLGLEDVGVVTDRGFVEVDTNTMETDEPGVFAVGDIVAGTPQLAHAGFAEGIAAVTYIATGGAAPVDYRAVPLVVYTEPEVASVGLTEEQAREAGYEVETHDHAFAAVARATIRGQTQGLVKVVSEKNGPILGATVAGPEAGELIHELMFAVGWEALPSEAAAFIHAHPTLAEAVGETLLSASGRSLH